MSGIGKPVLMIAYHYPPEGGSSGVLRTLKFTKYLPRHGWIPHVLTLRESSYAVRDEGLLRDIPPEVVVHRTLGFDTSRHFAIKRRYPAALTVPDRFLTWLPFGVVRGLRVIRAAGIRCLYSTCPQPTAHLIALALKSLTGLPWVADFRDPWVEDPGPQGCSSLRYRVETRLERAVVRRADRLVVTTPHLRGDVLRRYADLHPEKIQVIYNGYDEGDLAPVELSSLSKGQHFELLHAGLITPEYRNPAPLFAAVASLLTQGRLERSRVRVVFLGGGRYPDSPEFAAMVERHGLRDVVEVAPRVSHQEALARVRRADCLLLLQASDDTRSLIPAKAFEYLRAGRPILAMVPDGATADLLKDMQHCVVVNPADTRSLQHSVVSLYEAWRDSAGPVLVERQIRRFERSNLTAELARILHALSQGAPEASSA